MTPKGHRVIRGRRDLLYDPKGHGNLCGRFDLVYDPKRSQGSSSSSSIYSVKQCHIYDYLYIEYN